MALVCIFDLSPLELRIASDINAAVAAGQILVPACQMREIHDFYFYFIPFIYIYFHFIGLSTWTDNEYCLACSATLVFSKALIKWSENGRIQVSAIMDFQVP